MFKKLIFWRGWGRRHVSPSPPRFLWGWKLSRNSGNGGRNWQELSTKYRRLKNLKMCNGWGWGNVRISILISQFPYVLKVGTQGVIYIVYDYDLFWEHNLSDLFTYHINHYIIIRPIDQVSLIVKPSCSKVHVNTFHRDNSAVYW